MSRTLITAAAALAAPLLAVAVIAPASAQSQSPTRTLNDSVMLPAQIAYNHGTVYVADGGTSTVSKLNQYGKLVTLAHGPKGGDVAGLDLNRSGSTLGYTWTNFAKGKSGLTLMRDGGKSVTAHLYQYERTHNPDQSVTYGVPRTTSTCAKKAIAKLTGGPATYRGLVDSHPYGAASLGHGQWVVAEAAGNDLLRVSASGKISTLSVLPPQPATITKASAKAFGLPDCAIGVTYRFEAVPTDVEVGPNGMLWVSTLPGGPEDSTLGARGSVYKVNPNTGEATRVATGFAGATNLAVADGTVYVAELFGGRISTVRHGDVVAVRDLANALSVETHGRWLYVGTMATMDDTGTPVGNGSILKIRR